VELVLRPSVPAPREQRQPKRENAIRQQTQRRTGFLRGQLRKLWSDIRESFAEARFDIDRATEDDGVVLVLGTLRLRGTGSGAVADTPFGLSRRSSTELEDASSSGPATNPAPSRPWGCPSSRCRGITWRLSGEPSKRASPGPMPRLPASQTCAGLTGVTQHGYQGGCCRCVAERPTMLLMGSIHLAGRCRPG
jgi:hypothetical protein